MTTATIRGHALVNDLHSQLNATRVAAIVTPRNVDELRAADPSRAGRRQRRSRSPAAGTRWAASSSARARSSSTRADSIACWRSTRTRASSRVEGGIQWPALLDYLERVQTGALAQWGIYQKQTGADRLSLAGALACNAHGRGLTLKPIVAAGRVVRSRGLPRAASLTCSRTEHPDLFRLAIGGYGLFGVIARITLRLRPRVKVRRVVTIERDVDSSSIASTRGSATASCTAIFSSRSTPTADDFLRPRRVLLLRAGPGATRR